MKFWSCLCLIVVILIGNPSNTLASGLFSTPSNTLQDRLESFPRWQNLPQVGIAREDLIYPDWMAGDWQVYSTEVEQIAPLAPNVITPGFEDNKRYLDLTIKFQVRFERKYLPLLIGSPLPSLMVGSLPVVADRTFNSLQIAKTYLGKDAVDSVKVDPNNPNRQITFLRRGQGMVISTVTGRDSEIPAPNQFIATEITQQVFRRNRRIYVNQVETTSSYHLLESGNIKAEQITAIYLSPQDPDYFIAAGQPVALYRYKLKLSPIQSFLP